MVVSVVLVRPVLLTRVLSVCETVCEQPIAKKEVRAEMQADITNVRLILCFMKQFRPKNE